MPKITILPLNLQIEAPPDATIMAAAQDQGYYWPTTCGGEGRCTTCACVVVEGGDRLSEMGRSERKVLVEERGERVLSTGVRLACQARVHGDVVVEKIGVRLPFAALTSRPDATNDGDSA